ncbi:membrane protein [Ramlibacter tataouinensis]|uniref:Candidate membrane protein n=1 Tax=Ramlibacter tataouinensis (strain ATCC BAA-407 / DSM 14655 / LMG 21543 / TTB310) TaxID=365046 RepID=F5Y557_RAMTT|nr:membrane protein [Ramlibacter tataouinensis]AEG93897.1 candidate membrane protein [Ramlibacter tataouinensis TTB310]
MGTHAKSDRKIDLALSGGGIRSATVSLGVLQALAAHEWLGRIGTLSTVSGGGYIGTFLCRLAARVREHTPDAETAWTHTGRILLTPTSQDVSLAPGGVSPSATLVLHPLQWLRENSRYLTPSGSSDMRQGAAYYLRGLLALHFDLALVALMLGLAVVLGGFLADALFWLTEEPAVTARAALAQALGLPVPPCAAHGGAPAACGATWVASGWWLAALAVLALACAVGLAYWLTVRRLHDREDNPAAAAQEWTQSLMVLVSLAVFVALFAVWLAYAASRGRAWWPPAMLGGIAVAGVLIWALSLAAARLKTRRKQVRQAAPGIAEDTAGSQQQRKADTTWLTITQAQVDRQRRWLTVWLSRCLVALVVLAVVAALDTLAMSLVQHHARQGDWWPWTVPAAAYGTLLAAAWRWLTQAESQQQGASRWRNWTDAAVLLLALAVAATLALAYLVMAYALVVDDARALARPFQGDWALGVLLLAGLVLAAACMHFAPGFLNLSSFHNLYAARLKRAYLGAANPERLSELRRPVDAARLQSSRAAFVNEVRAGDEPSDIDKYIEDNDRTLGIEHVINVTVNQRLSTTSPTLARDRQGVAMCLARDGVFVEAALRGGPGHPGPRFTHAQMKASPLTLAQWVAISGAAFSVGVGKETRPGYALLAFLANVRTAYWWPAPRADGPAGPGGLWCLLLEEMRCRFLGTQGRYWYLSDGGHFDNTAAYELVRRRSTHVLASDNGADPHYRFDDLTHLLRRIRIDFGAEGVIRSREELVGFGFKAEGFGTPEDFRRAQQKGESQPWALWVEIYHDRESGRPRDTASEPPDGIIVWVKPARVADWPADVGHYAQTHARFPQETTADQFFDEAQWESYRRLGELLAGRVLAADVFRHMDARLQPPAGPSATVPG